MIMEFKKGRRLFFVLFIIFALLAVKLFVPLKLAGLDFTQIPPFFPIKNRFLKLCAFALVFLVGEGFAAILASAINNKEFKRLSAMLLMRCECEQFNAEFAPAVAARSANIGVALGKWLLYTQGLFAAGRYAETVAAAEEALALPMGKADIPMYLTRSAVCKYLIMACCEMRDTGKAAKMFAELEESVSHTVKDKEKNRLARRMLTFTRSYITFSVNPKYCVTEPAEEELRLSVNTYEKIMNQYLLGRLYLRAGKTEEARAAFTYVAERHSEFACRAAAAAALEKLPALPAESAAQ